MRRLLASTDLEIYALRTVSPASTVYGGMSYSAKQPAPWQAGTKPERYGAGGRSMTSEEMLTELLRDDSQHAVAATNAILQAIWPFLHAPQHRHSAAELVALFQRAGYVSDGFPQPSSALTIYRGELMSIHEPGISWTTDLQIAKQYAQGYVTTGHARVIQATALPEAVLARFHRESEVVVAPHLLRNRKELGGFQHFALPRLTPF